MTDSTLTILLYSAVGIAVVHTLIGVDHTLPFVVLGRARKWSLKKTLGLTAACGVGHILASVALGTIGIAAGMALERINWINDHRGAVEGWLLIGFGLAYAAWSIVRRNRGQVHAHPHIHEDGSVHTHDHNHHNEHLHPHTSRESGRTGNMVTAWALFLIFAFGPCESLIPLLMVPAAQASVWSTALVAIVFGLATIGTMLAVVTVGYLGLRMTWLQRVERHAHTLAGLAIAISGAMIYLFSSAG